MDKAEIRQINHPNAIRFRWHNKRVLVADMDDGVYLEFWRLRSDKDVESENMKILRGKVTVTRIALTLEAAHCLTVGLIKTLNRK